MERTAIVSVVGFILGLGLAQAAWGEAKEIVRGIYADPGGAVDNRLWASYGAGYETDDREKHKGKLSIRCANETDKDAHGAGQTIRFNQDKPRPLVVAGWAKLEGVTGAADFHCSVYLDVALRGGQGWPMKIAAFDPSKKGWQYAEQTYTPPAPIESARVYVFLRERKGVAWFDDLFVGEALDDKGTRSKNLLTDPGFEGPASDEGSPRDKFFGKLKEIGCNAFHFYRSVPWEKVMDADALPAIDPKDPLLDFVNDAHRRGFKVWLTAGVGLPKIESLKSPEHPFWPCVNNRWGTAYTRAVAYFAQYGIDGIGMVPDEWNYDTSAVRRLAEHRDPEVAEFYKKLPSYCECDVCKAKFRERTGLDHPGGRKPWSTADAVWAHFIKFRYDSTAAWMRRSVEATKKVNPKIVTDTMICVLPVCSDNRLHTGAAWDQIGVETGLDCLQTDPYIQLHNYLGDSTHYYPTETTLHLTSANWRGLSGVTLESCRLRDTYRDKEPVEVYGAALSCLAHGASEFFWWHFNYVDGKSAFVDPKPPTERVAAAYKVMQAMEPHVLTARVPGELLVLYSRASEDSWHWLADKNVLPTAQDEKPNAKRGFQAHRNALYWLLRRGYPFQMTFVDNPDPERLKAAKALIVPFPFSLKESEVKAIEDQARAGKTIILMSELSPVDELGKVLAEPRLARLFAGQKPDPRADGAVESSIGKGKVMFLGGDFAMKLFEEWKLNKDPKSTVQLPGFDVARTATLEKLITAALGRPASLFAEQPAQDVEAALLEGKQGRLLLLINWDFTNAAQAHLRSPVGGACQAEGFAISREATVKDVRTTYSGDRWTIELSPQEARLLKLVSK